MATLPLTGVRVLELTTGAAGPTVGRTLAEFGAEVIRVESRRRLDSHRGQNQAKWNQRPDFVKLNRGKKSVTINMSIEKGRAVMKRLVAKSDVLVENFAMGVLENWGLLYDDLKAVKPDIILVRVKGLGSTGPHATDVTWGPNVGNIMGSTYLWNYPKSEFSTGEARSQHPDFMGGVTAAYAVVLALIHRRRTGEGQWIDSAQLEVGASLLGPKYLEYHVNGTEPEPMGNHSLVAAPYGAFRCAPTDADRWCVIGVYGDADWQTFCRVTGRPELAGDPRFATHVNRIRNAISLRAEVEQWTSLREPHVVMETLQAAGVMAAAVQDVEDQFKRDKQYEAHGFLVSIDEPELGPLVTEGVPVRLSRTPGGVQGYSPLVGEHTVEVMESLLEMTPDEVKALEAAQVLY